MGWSSYHAKHYKRNGQIDKKAELDEGWEKGYRVLKSTMHGNIYYAAIERTSDSGEKIVFAVIGHTHSNLKDYMNFSYKLMDETMGPYNYDCPNSILDLLSPTDSEWANEWRKKCKEHKMKPKLCKLPIGSMISYENFEGEKIILEKRAPNYQFKKTWWYRPAKNTYVPSRRIPDDWEQIS